jgi:hypothetical protein
MVCAAGRRFERRHDLVPAGTSGSGRGTNGGAGMAPSELTNPMNKWIGKIVTDNAGMEIAAERRIARRALIVSALFFPLVGFVNAMSFLTDAGRMGLAVDPREPWILEVTSVLVLIALVPLVARLERWMPLAADSWMTALAAYAVGSIAFSVLHVAGMILLRKLVFAAFLGEGYIFFDEPFRDLLYEYRKDILPYSAVILVLSLLRSLEEHRREADAAKVDARTTGKLTLKCAGRTIFLDAASFEWAQAAGNYVEVRARGVTNLARISLAALAEQLGAAGVDAVQVHRSHLVNRARIVEIAPGRDGDFRVRMADGSDIRGSRRYRQALSA